MVQGREARKSGRREEKGIKEEFGTKEPRHTFQKKKKCPHSNESDSIHSVSPFIPTRVSKPCAEEVRGQTPGRGACARAMHYVFTHRLISVNRVHVGRTRDRFCRPGGLPQLVAKSLESWG